MLRSDRRTSVFTLSCLTLALPSLTCAWLLPLPALAETPAEKPQADKTSTEKTSSDKPSAQPTPPASPTPPPAPQEFQRFPGRQGMMLERIQKVFGELDLTDDQKEEVQMIFMEARSRFRELAPELRDLSPEERRLALRDEMTQLRDRLTQILTPEQRLIVQEKIAQMQVEERPPRPADGPKSPNSPDQRPFPEKGGGGGGGAGGGAGMRPGMIREAVLSLDLTVDQRQAVNDLFNEQAQKFVGIDPTSPEIQDVFRASAKEVREKLSTILTAEQQDQLRNKIIEQGGFRTPPSAPPSSPPSTSPFSPRPDGPRRRPSTQPTAPDSGQSPAPATPLAAVGAPAPDLLLHRLQGPPVKLSNYTGRNVVLVFGSQSAPTFRQKAQPMLDMQRAIGRRADVLIVYTAEAFPEGTDIRRNRDDGIAIAQHSTLQERQAAAQKAIKDLKLTALVVLDDMNNTAATAFAASPNGAALIGRDGKVLLLQRNFDPHAMAEAVLTLPAAASPPPPAPADSPATAPAN